MGGQDIVGALQSSRPSSSRVRRYGDMASISRMLLSIERIRNSPAIPEGGGAGVAGVGGAGMAWGVSSSVRFGGGVAAVALTAALNGGGVIALNGTISGLGLTGTLACFAK